MNVSRRGFLSGIIAACAAPAIIRTAGLLMPIKPKLVDNREAMWALLNKRLLDAREVMIANIMNNQFNYGNADVASRYNWEATMRESERLLGFRQEGIAINFERTT